MDPLEEFARTCYIENMTDEIKKKLGTMPDKEKMMFTFGHGQSSPNRYLIMPSRKDMFDLFGPRWSMQYDYKSDHKEYFGEFRMYEISLDEALKNHELHDHDYRNRDD